MHEETQSLRILVVEDEATRLVLLACIKQSSEYPFRDE